MNKSESKYFYTARLMSESLLILLEKKDIDYITVKEICEKAGVNRSTFYLHYDTIDDLFAETIERLNHDFVSSFEIKDVKPLIKTADKEDMIFIKKEFLEPYLEFVKKNKRVLKMIHKRPVLFKSENIYNKMSEELFFPILTKFGVPKEEQIYKLEFFTKGTAAIISKWLMLDCEVPIPKIMEIVIDCINFSKNDI